MIKTAAFIAAALTAIYAVVPLMAQPDLGQNIEGDPVCYMNDGERVVPEYEVEYLMTKVNWFDTTQEMRAAVLARNPDWDVSDMEGYSECTPYTEGVTVVMSCEIWVERPQFVFGDPRMDSLGHEILHGLMGGFHE